MKKIIVLLMALCIAFALVGCNIAPNVPRVTPYVTNGNGNFYNNPNTVNPPNANLRNPADKYALPGVGNRQP